MTVTEAVKLLKGWTEYGNEKHEVWREVLLTDTEGESIAKILLNMENQIELLKCCGNCEFSFVEADQSWTCYSRAEKHLELISQFFSCNDWKGKSDAGTTILTRLHRMEGALREIIELRYMKRGFISREADIAKAALEDKP